MKIRKVIKDDNVFLAKMIRSVFEEHNASRCNSVYSDPTTDNLYELFQTEERSILWVAEEDHRIMGSCGIYPTKGLPERCAELVKFYLSKESRGKGLGKMLLEKSIESARGFGYSEIYIESSLPEFAVAVSMYQKQGFSKLKTPLGESGHTASNVWMLRRIID